jgi:hypothetical protein
MTRNLFVPSRLVVVVLAVATACASEQSPADTSAQAQQDTVLDHLPRQVTAMLAFQDQMRKLWEDHIQWTRHFIISTAHALPDAGPTTQRLLANQVDIGNAVKPFYGNAAGKTLTKLLKEHIIGAVTLMSAAKSGDDAATAKAKADWYVNGNKIADFLHSANPKAWSKATMRSMMKVHLDQTLDEAVNRLNGRFAADIRDYDHVHRHILMMADALSSGIIHQFPKRFR